MNDYESFLIEYGLTESFVQLMVQNEDDQCAMPDGYALWIKESPIHGVGAFAYDDIAEHTLIAPARVNGKRTPAGRYVNHSETPNAQFFPHEDGDLDLISTFPITKNEEITIDYRQAMAVNGSGLNPVIDYLPKLIKQHGIDVSGMSNRQIIEVVEWIFLQGDNIVDQLPIREFVFGGMYAREMTIPKGIAATGKIHHDEHFCFLSQGDISIMTDDGMTRVKAPYIFEAKAGIKKMAYAHETSVFTTVHATTLTDANEIYATSMSDGDISWVNNLLSGDNICQVD